MADASVAQRLGWPLPVSELEEHAGVYYMLEHMIAGAQRAGDTKAAATFTREKEKLWTLLAWHAENAPEGREGGTRG